MNFEISTDDSDLKEKLEKLEVSLRRVPLEAAAASVRHTLDSHFLRRQSIPRQDGLPSQGFWVGNRGHSVAESVQPTVYTDESATITIDHAPLAHKLNPNPPLIRPGAGKQFLTIPATAEAASRPARDFSNLKFAYRAKDGTGFMKGKNVVPVLVDSGSGRVWYWLARKVQTKHDPNALPPGDTIQQSAVTAMDTAVNLLLSS